MQSFQGRKDVIIYKGSKYYICICISKQNEILPNVTPNHIRAVATLCPKTAPLKLLFAFIFITDKKYNRVQWAQEDA